MKAAGPYKGVERGRSLGVATLNKLHLFDNLRLPERMKRPQGFGARWREGDARNRARNLANLSGKLEGPGSVRRLSRIQRRFVRANQSSRRAGVPLGLGLVVFLAVVVGGLCGPNLLAEARAAGGMRLQAQQSRTFVYYRNCTAAHAAGAYSIPRGAPGYRPALDGDNDGLACEPYYVR